MFGYFVCFEYKLNYIKLQKINKENRHGPQVFRDMLTFLMNWDPNNFVNKLYNTQNVSRKDVKT